MLRGRAGSKILGAGRSGAVLKIFGFGAVWGSHFSRGRGGACIPATLFIYALVLQISKCREIHTFWCNLLASKTAAAEFYLTNIKSTPFVYLCVFCSTASGWTLRRRSAQTIRTPCLPAGWRSRTLQNPTLQTQRGADAGTADLRESGGVGGREFAPGSDGLPAGWWWLRGSWAGWEAARQERAGTTRPATRR